MGCIDNTHVSGVPLFHRQRNSAAARRDLPSRLPRVTLTLRAALHAASFAQERHYPLRVACASWMQIGRNVRLRAANKGSAQPSGGCGRRGGTGVYVGTCRFRAPAAPAWRQRSSFDSCSKQSPGAALWMHGRAIPAVSTARLLACADNGTSLSKMVPA